jgi:hypothetical protein
MTNRRNVAWIIALLMAIGPLAPIAARADQAFQRFLPLFTDLDGWQGKKPDGMSMQMSGANMTSAQRDYTRGPARLHVAVIVGTAAAGVLAPLQAGMTYETSEGHMITTTLDGYKIMKTYNTAQKSGALLIGLDASAALTVAYNGITEDEGLALAKKFDWKAFQAAAEQK